MASHRRRRQHRASWRARGRLIWSMRNPDRWDGTAVVAGDEFAVYSSAFVHRRKWRARRSGGS